MIRPATRWLFLALSCAALDAQQYDLLLKGGHVIDPANNLSAIRDVAVANDKIARVAADIPASQARQVVDVKQLYVTPGLVDIHAHVYTKFVGGMMPYVLPDPECLPNGVTTVVDAGSSGYKNFEDFKQKYIDTAKTRVLAFLNIGNEGTRTEAEQEMRLMEVAPAAAMVRKYPKLIVGIKTAHYWTTKPFDAGHPPWISVERAVEAGNAANVPVMVDFWPRPERPYPDLILKKLRPGDIHTHVFAQQFPVVDKNGKVYDYMFEARKRGVIFDVGHGSGSFWFRIADPALKGGFAPDSISTDLHTDSRLRTVFSMINCMAKYLNLGMPIEEVIRRATVNPAREIRRPELGTLSVGSEADIAVISVLQGRFGFADCGRAKMTGDRNLENLLTVRGGQIVYDVQGLSMPDWRKAPPRYWFTPKLQGEPPPASH